MTHPRITVECSEDVLLHLGADASTIETVDALTELAWARYGVSVCFVIYQGMDSSYAGGRMVGPSPEETENTARVLNQHGISFALALNGGLTLPGEIELSDRDMHVLRTLESNNRRWRVNNKVIVTHERMLALMRSRYPSLEVVASCIQAVNPRAQRGYAERLKEYDYVVPINQHSTYEYLKRYSACAHKLILLLTMRCGRTDLAKCYAHYAAVEEHFGETGSRRVLDEKELPEFEPSVLPSDAHGCILLNEFGPRVSLLDRQEDLSKLMAMGVASFKIARLYTLQQSTYEKLLRGAQQWCRKS